MLTPQEIKATAALFKAIGNPYRLQIVSILVEGESNVMTLNKQVLVSQPALSQHLSKLRKAGVLQARRAQREIFYSIKDANILRLLGVGKEMVKGA